MKIDNIGTSQSFKAIKYMQFPTFVPSFKFLRQQELKNVDPELRKVIENAPLLKKLGEKTDIFVCHSKKKDSNMHMLTVDFLDERPPYDFGIGEFYHEQILLAHDNYTNEGFYKHIANLFNVLVDDFKKFKSEKYMDTILVRNPRQIMTFVHHGKVNITD